MNFYGNWLGRACADLNDRFDLQYFWGLEDEPLDRNDAVDRNGVRTVRIHEVLDGRLEVLGVEVGGDHHGPEEIGRLVAVPGAAEGDDLPVQLDDHEGRIGDGHEDPSGERAVQLTVDAVDDAVDRVPGVEGGHEGLDLGGEQLDGRQRGSVDVGDRRAGVQDGVFRHEAPLTQHRLVFQAGGVGTRYDLGM